MKMTPAFEGSASAIRNRVRQADRDEGRREDGLTTADLEELRGHEPDPPRGIWWRLGGVSGPR